MKELTAGSRQAQKKQIHRKVLELVRTYMNLKGKLVEDIDLNHLKFIKVMQALTEDEDSLFSSIQHDQEDLLVKSRGLELMGIKEEYEFVRMRKIGIEEHEPLEKVLLSKFAQRSFEIPSSEDNEKKSESKIIQREDYLLAKEQENEVKFEESKLNHKEPLVCNLQKEQQNEYIQSQKRTTRKIPRVFYEEDLEESLNIQDQRNDSFSLSNIDDSGEVIEEVSQEEDECQTILGRKCSKISKSNKKIKKCVIKKVKQVKSLPKHRTYRKSKLSQPLIRRGRKPENPQMEVTLINWIIDSINQGVILTQQDIRIRAKISSYQKTKNKKTQFAASKGWMQKFFKRHPDIFELITLSKINAGFENRSRRQAEKMQRFSGFKVMENIDREENRQRMEEEEASSIQSTLVKAPNRNRSPRLQ